MTQADVTNLVVAFLAALASAVLVASWGALRQWRTRDRQLTRITALVTVHQSPVLSEREREELARRISFQVDDYLHGDSLRRAFGVQRIAYVMLGAIALALGWAASEAEQSVARYGLLAGAVVCVIVAVGITGVPPAQWSMPSALQSYRDPTKSKPARSALAEWAADETNLQEGQSVIVFQSGDGRDLDHLRQVVGEGGVVLGVEPDVNKSGWSENAIALRGWKNVHVTQSLDQVKGGAFDVAIVKEVVLKLAAADLAETIEELHRLLRPGGKIMVFAVRPSVAQRHKRADDLLVAISTRFDEVQHGDLGRAGLVIKGTRPA